MDVNLNRRGRGELMSPEKVVAKLLCYLDKVLP
jgi:hypothetical protein